MQRKGTDTNIASAQADRAGLLNRFSNSFSTKCELQYHCLQPSQCIQPQRVL
jgi:hypothetical protein